MFGFYPRHLIFYTHYEGPIDRDQFLLTLVSRFVMLSVIPLVFCASLGEASTLLRFVSLLNGVGMLTAAERIGVTIFDPP